MAQNTMSGLENILNEIRAKAKTEAETIARAAEEEAAKVKEEAGKEADALLSKAETEAAEEAARTNKRYESLADTRKKQALLTAKQELIGSAIEKAKEKVLSLEDSAYFAMLSRMLEKNLLGKDGTLYLNAKDLARLPEGFAAEAAAKAAAKGGTLTLSEEAKEMDGGFVLSYGGIEENCCIEAIFEEHADELRDTVAKLLFS